MGEQVAFWAHINALTELTEALTSKTAYTNLGPADGRLYMQLCDTLAAYAKNLEGTFDDIRNKNSSDSSEDDTESSSDSSPSPK